jgi:hypothetical protein
MSRVPGQMGPGGHGERSGSRGGPGGPRPHGRQQQLLHLEWNALCVSVCVCVCVCVAACVCVH